MTDFESVCAAWEFVQNTLNYFNFSPSICTWITTFQYITVSCETQT